MRYFSGFGLCNESYIFIPIIKSFGFRLGEFDIVGFDYGAQIALEYASNLIDNNRRIGKLLLISPCIYFHNLGFNQILNMRVSQSNLCFDSKINDVMSYIDSKAIYDIANNESNLCKTTSNQIITHVCSNLETPHIESCLASFRHNPVEYMSIIYKHYGLFANDDLLNYKRFEAFFVMPNISDLENLLSYKWTKIEKVAQKVKSIVVFCGKNDRIINANFISSFFSHFGYCFLLDSCSHALRRC
ncbi:hypothetical protein LS73_004020 [Helicobacter muridarum]|uniref:Alpha/beta hydrolase n=1 Tax=Helicobacter muridarum TaxID=216 RepID=A0A377PT05_9HELI|nr:hypothetical protein [Helicobacter muridarum]TLE00585.1 hypothetical protein LS73_004020 [Helicobacter muridarum]STQ85599.1 Uncharacterised protein [Helicobacter muridarum]